MKSTEPSQVDNEINVIHHTQAGESSEAIPVFTSLSAIAEVYLFVFNDLSNKTDIFAAAGQNGKMEFCCFICRKQKRKKDATYSCGSREQVLQHLTSDTSEFLWAQYCVLILMGKANVLSPGQNKSCSKCGLEKKQKEVGEIIESFSLLPLL